MYNKYIIKIHYKNNKTNNVLYSVFTFEFGLGNVKFINVKQAG